MLCYAPPDFKEIEGDELSNRSRAFVNSRRETASQHRGSPRSLSPPAEADYSTIATEAMKWADIRATPSSRKKMLTGNSDGKGKPTATGQVLGGGDGSWGCGSAHPFVPAEVPEKSLLTQLIATHSAGKRQMNLKVYSQYCKTENGRPIPTHVRVLDTANAIDVVKATIRALRDANVDINQNPDAYKLRVAEDDRGNPDEDLPVLDKKTTLKRMGFDALVLCNTSTAHKRRRVRTLEDLVFTVVCGADRKVARRVSLPPDLIFKDALSCICDRFNKKDSARYTLRLLNESVEGEIHGTHHVPYTDRSLGALYREFGVSELYLRPKMREVDQGESEEELEPPAGAKAKLFRDWDEASASRYSEYTIVKINKFGLRQHRVLGIDREKIYNMMVGNKVQKTKNPERSINDIVYIRTFAEKPCYIEIEYKNSKSGKDQIECQSPMEAHELETKVTFLLGLHRHGGQAATAEKKSPAASGMDKLLAKITPVLHSPRGEART